MDALCLPGGPVKPVLTSETSTNQCRSYWGLIQFGSLDSSREIILAVVLYPGTNPVLLDFIIASGVKGTW